MALAEIQKRQMKWLLSSKIHRATVTESELDYVGSITIDEELAEKAGIWTGERVLVTSVTSGARLETYVIMGKRGSGVICMNGPTAHLIKKGEIIVIMGFQLSDIPVKSKVIFVDEKNKFLRYLND